MRLDNSEITTDDLRALTDFWACTIDPRSICDGLSDVMSWNWILPYLHKLGFDLQPLAYREVEDEWVFFVTGYPAWETLVGVAS